MTHAPLALGVHAICMLLCAHAIFVAHEEANTPLELTLLAPARATRAACEVDGILVHLGCAWRGQRG